MALDGITIANITYELGNALTDSRLYKIAQPEPDELMLTFKKNGRQYRLTISANAGLPLIYLTENNKQSPLTAPSFCMLLRKHLGNARVIAISQPGLERIIDFTLEHLDEMGDVCRKHLVVELMGKHSNIIFTDDNNRIIDSIKRVSAQVSSVREVLPGRDYFIPDTLDKADPLALTKEDFNVHVLSKPIPVGKALYMGLTGISPVIAEELCLLSGIDSATPANVIGTDTCVDPATPANVPVADAGMHLFNMTCRLMDDVKAHRFLPNIIYKGNAPVEFASINLSMYEGSKAYTVKLFDSASLMLYTYYAERNAVSRIHQRSTDMRKIVNTLLERTHRKYDIQEKQLKDTLKRDKFRIYGELINTYGYGIPEGAKSFDALNYYTNETITIPLDETLSAHDNAIKYFDKYNKLKRTFEATSKLLEETEAELDHLESISNSLDIAVCEDDLLQLRQEMVEAGYIHKKSPNEKKVNIKSRPFHYISSDGYHIYVGKNNLQNEELSFRLATGNDWWFHAKKLPGSHVIVKTNGDDLPDRTFEEAARLAAHYSKAGDTTRVEVDYTQKKNLKKPPAGKPGFVIYHTNYSLVADTDISGIQVCE